MPKMSKNDILDEIGWKAETLKSHSFFIQTPFLMKSPGLGPKWSLICVVKVADPYNEVWINGMHFSEDSSCFWVFKHGACLTIASQLSKFKYSFSWIFFHNNDLKMHPNNFLVGRFLIQILLVWDLQWCFYTEKSEKMDEFWGALSPSSTVGSWLYFLGWIPNQV